MSGVTEEQPPPAEHPDEDDQPIVPMLDLSDPDGTEAAEAGFGQGVELSRLRMLGGVLLLFAALGLVIALVLPLYQVSVGPGELGPDNDFVVNAWGMIQQAGIAGPVQQLINAIVGDTPMWGIPLVFVALLLAAAGGVALWQPAARYVAGGAIAATALLLGCFAMLAEFLVAQADPNRFGGPSSPVRTVIGPSFWLLVFAVVLAIAGLAAVLLGRPVVEAPVPVEPAREEPPTPPMGFPAPVVLPELDEK
jgi:hypothetical protein